LKSDAEIFLIAEEKKSNEMELLTINEGDKNKDSYNL